MRKLLNIREPVNTLTHFITFIAAIVGLFFLVILAKNNTSKLLTMTVYGVSLITLYGASSLYHWVKTSPGRQRALRKFDHISIYILIAGSYTPVFYYGLEGPWKWSMLSSVWALAAVGIILKIFFLNAPRTISTVFYITLGWIALVPFIKLVGNIPVGGIVLMVAGGVAYTVGAIIYATKCFNFIPNRFGFHEIFHIFIMAGSITHFFMMIFYIMPL
ncbi:hypothetical protein DCCM_2679 [Desulfocucumis palustris]|uniref:Membrane protein hemolysin III n=1 Tax=Desulfocucumis palustris TaxID=1898651 RepID=A0A2L2XH80_9FIRM|nr:hemolysin III family protein [Desulfocucumis palustris]GBF33576.1 hypothetical protein DCCM_2679 [Desulfocucumis palustris]